MVESTCFFFVMPALAPCYAVPEAVRCCNWMCLICLLVMCRTLLGAHPSLRETFLSFPPTFTILGNKLAVGLRSNHSSETHCRLFCLMCLRQSVESTCFLFVVPALAFCFAVPEAISCCNRQRVRHYRELTPPRAKPSLPLTLTTFGNKPAIGLRSLH